MKCISIVENTNKSLWYILLAVNNSFNGVLR